MKKKTYNAPQCTAVQMNVENFICLSIPIGSTPGGGGQAKANYFFEEEDESASDFSESDSEESKGNKDAF